MIYLFTIILSLYFSWIYDIREKKEYKNECYLIILCIFISIAGFRYRIGADTCAYLNWFYCRYPNIADFSFEDYPIGKDPFWVIVNSLLISIGAKFFIFQFVHSAFVNILLFNYFKKHSKYVFTCIFFYSIYCYTSFNFEVLRASVSIIICLYGNDYIIQKKWLKGYLLYFVALMFHAQTLLIFFTPLLFSFRIDKKGIIVLLLSFVVGVVLQKFFIEYTFLLDFNENIEKKASIYGSSDFANETPIKYVIIKTIPTIAYVIFPYFLLRRNRKSNTIERLMPFYFVGLTFMLMEINFNLAYRYVDYYRVYIIIVFAEFFMYVATFTKYHDFKIAYFKAIIVFIPLFLLMGAKYYGWKNRYYPYCSIFDRKLDPSREILFSEMNTTEQRLSIDKY